ncbi:MAG: response regulator [Bacteroidota bacterium]
MSQEKILIVEDDEVVSFILKQILTELDYAILSIVRDGESAIVEAENNKPDLILMDISLAGKINGIEAAIKIREKNDIPVLFLTAFVNEDLFKQAIGTEPYGFIIKPFKNLELKSAVELAIKKHKKELKAKKEKENLHIMLNELEQTNNNLVAATFREREIKKKLEQAMNEIANLNEIAKAKEIIEKQNIKINESINYALKIQNSIHVNQKHLKEFFTNSFIYFKPKDVVSGDFPWMFKKQNYVYVAAVDCTGHGVPGAMMSIIGSLLLNDIANDEQINTPAEILNALHKKVVYTLKQNTDAANSNDGMDIGLIRVDLTTNEIVFSGAHHKLLYASNGELNQLKGDKFPIGGLHYEKKRTPYQNNTICLNKNDLLFLFTDGIVDQIGGENSTKYMFKNLENNISKNIFNPIENISESIRLDINNWMQNHKQVDDMLLIGIQL